MKGRDSVISVGKQGGAMMRCKTRVFREKERERAPERDREGENLLSHFGRRRKSRRKAPSKSHEEVRERERAFPMDF
jgi:hypothetical protein